MYSVSMCSSVGEFRRLEIVDEVTQGEVDVVEVIAPAWPESLGDDRTRVARRGDAIDLKPGGARLAVAGRGVQTGIGDPGRFWRRGWRRGVDREESGVQGAGA